MNRKLSRGKRRRGVAETEFEGRKEGAADQNLFQGKKVPVLWESGSYAPLD